MAKTYHPIVLCGDIGATNTRLAIVGFIGSKPQVLLIKFEPTKTITHFDDFVAHALEQVHKEHSYAPKTACFGVAGPIISQNCKLTNANLVIDAKKIEQRSKIKVLLINDFAAVGYGINVLAGADFKTLQLGKADIKSPKIVLGAGSGLGKSILFHSPLGFEPVSSEGGHADLPLLNPLEYPLADFIKQKRKRTYLCYDDVLSGQGIEDIYDYLQYTRYPHQPKKLSAEAISRTRKSNMCSKETFTLFVRFFARCAKNYTLDTLATGGVYLAGGIVAKNIDMFTSQFNQEFCKNDKYQKLLRKVPIKMVKNEHAGLLGAAYAAVKYVKEVKK